MNEPADAHEGKREKGDGKYAWAQVLKFAFYYFHGALVICILAGVFTHE